MSFSANSPAREMLTYNRSNHESLELLRLIFLHFIKTNYYNYLINNRQINNFKYENLRIRDIIVERQQAYRLH